MVARLKTPEPVIERLFLATLSRPPTAAELGAMTSHVARATDRRAAYHDVLWALVNSSEFVSNH